MNSSNDALYTAIGTGIMMIYLLFMLVLMVLTLIAMWKVYKKADKPGWACIVPFYSQYCMYDITWGNGWLFLLTFVPIANLVVGIMTFFKLAKSFGKGIGFGFGLLFLNIIFMMILAFDKSEYIGPQ